MSSEVWDFFTGSDAEWNKALAGQLGVSYLHQSGWERVLVTKGWKANKWVCRKDTHFVSFTQTFLKTYLSGTVGIMWVPDWITGDLIYGARFYQMVKDKLKLKLLYIRIRSHRPLTSNGYIEIVMQGWKRPIMSLGAGLTMSLNLLQSREQIELNTSRNWSRNLKRSQRSEYAIERIQDPEIIVKLYEELQELKNLESTLSRQEIVAIMQEYQDNLIVLGAVAPEGEVLAIRGAIYDGMDAWDIFAATSLVSRKKYISYAVLVELLMACKQVGCERFDFGGIDPVNNVGVYNFKKGTGAQAIITLGEFDMSNSKIFMMAVNIGTKLKQILAGSFLSV